VECLCVSVCANAAAIGSREAKVGKNVPPAHSEERGGGGTPDVRCMQEMGSGRGTWG